MKTLQKPTRHCHELYRQPPEDEREYVRGLKARSVVAKNAQAFVSHRLTGIDTEAMHSPRDAAEALKRAAGRLVLAAERIQELDDLPDS